MSFAAEAFTGKLPPGLPLRGTLGSATGGTSCAGSADFVQTSHRVTLSPVTTSKTFQVTLCDDGASLPPKPSSSTELFQVRGFSPSNATLAQSIGVIAIQAR